MGEDNYNQYVDGAKQRVHAIRLRTWTLTLAIIVALVLYLLVTVTTKTSINLIDFLLTATLQIVCNGLYFPDGELFGQKDAAYIANKKGYNAKANAINQNKQMGKLREYCKVEYAERKARYIEAQCAMLNITQDELEQLREFEPTQIKTLKYIMLASPDGEEHKLVLSSMRRKRLYALLFKKLPIEENQPETIMSAIEIDSRRSIRDGSVVYKRAMYTRRVLQSLVVGLVLAYIGYTAREGIGLAEIVSICVYLTSMFITSVFSFANGEKCSKVHKSRFYLELSNFIDGFQEWAAKGV